MCVPHALPHCAPDGFRLARDMTSDAGCARRWVSGGGWPTPSYLRTASGGGWRMAEIWLGTLSAQFTVWQHNMCHILLHTRHRGWGNNIAEFVPPPAR